VWLTEHPNHPPATPLFRSKAPGEPGAITRQQAWTILERAYAAWGLTAQLGTHSMRKSFARAGHDLVKTQRALGIDPYQPLVLV
jgi:site-specific recombinase XerD